MPVLNHCQHETSWHLLYRRIEVERRLRSCILQWTVGLAILRLSVRASTKRHSRRVLLLLHESQRRLLPWLLLLVR